MNTLKQIILIASIIAAGFAAHAAVNAKNKAKAKIEVIMPAPQEEFGPDDTMDAKLVAGAPTEVGAKAPSATISSTGDTAPIADIDGTDKGTVDSPAIGGTENDALAKSVVLKIPENQIPVLANSKGIKKATESPVTRILITLGVLAMLLGGTILGLKRWAARGGKTRQTTQIKILTQHILGPKKSLAIIQVAGESILIGVTDHNISMLKTLSLIDDEIPEETPKSFGRALDQFEDEDFAVQGISEIRDTVSKRLKTMKSF